MVSPDLPPSLKTNPLPTPVTFYVGLPPLGCTLLTPFSEIYLFVRTGPEVRVVELVVETFVHPTPSRTGKNNDLIFGVFCEYVCWTRPIFYLLLCPHLAWRPFPDFS